MSASAVSLVQGNVAQPALVVPLAHSNIAQPALFAPFAQSNVSPVTLSNVAFYGGLGNPVLNASPSGIGTAQLWSTGGAAVRSISVGTDVTVSVRLQKGVPSAFEVEAFTFEHSDDPFFWYSSPYTTYA